jgi:hypothetical protein
MPTRSRDKNNTLMVRFYEDVADKEVHAMLAWLGISGNRVSTLIKRWAVEVPYWREEEFLDKLYESDLVEAISGHFNKTKLAAEAYQLEEKSDENQ